MNKVLVVLGILFLIGAGVSAIFTITMTSSNSGFYGVGASSTTTQIPPYAMFTLPLGAIGIVLLLVGLAVKG